jgi:hypothetical protein
MSDQIQIELKGQNHPFAFLIKGQEELNKAFISNTQSTLSEGNLEQESSERSIFSLFYNMNDASLDYSQP